MKNVCQKECCNSSRGIVRCDEYFFKKMFQKGMQFPTEPAILKRAYIFQMEFNEYEKKFPQKKSFLWNMSSRICYVRLWDILHTPFVFFSNLDNVLFLSMFYVVMHRCVEMHVDVYDIDAFRCTTIYIYIHMYTDDCRCIS